MIGYKWIDKNRNSVFARNEFKVHYPKNIIVKVSEDTQGMMCFKTIKDANDWHDKINSILWSLEGWKLIEVKPISKIYNFKYYNIVFSRQSINSVCKHINKVGIEKFWSEYVEKLYPCKNIYNMFAVHKLKVLT